MLSKEIIHRILEDVGALPIKNFGAAGLTLPDLNLHQNFIVELENNEQVHYNMWCGQGSLPSMKIKALLVDLQEDNCMEFALALRVDNKPIYALRLSDMYGDNGDFLIKEGENWISPTVVTKCLALIGMEMIVDQGMLWQPLSDYHDLYEAISHLVEIQSSSV